MKLTVLESSLTYYCTGTDKQKELTDAQYTVDLSLSQTAIINCNS